MKIVLFPAIAVLSLALGCQSSKPPAPENPEPSTKGLLGRIVPLSKSVDYRCVEVPLEADLIAWLPAQAVHAASGQALISSPVSGVISGTPLMTGRPVVKGAPLVEVRSPELAELKSRWLKAQAQLRRAEADLAREQRLAAARAGSARELESAEAEQSAAKAEAEAARLVILARGINPEKATETYVIQAPMAGVVAEWKIAQGQGVQANETLGSFQAVSANQVQMELAASVQPAWALGTRTQARNGSGNLWTAKVEGLPPGIEQGTQRLTYRLSLSGAPMPLSGAFLEVKVPVGRGMRIPTSALQQIEGTWGVFLREGDVARFQEVRRGPDTERDTLVLGGLSAGAKVIIDGAFLLKSQLIRAQAGGGHD